MTQALETLLPCPFCAVDIAEACPMEDGTAVCYHRHTESNCILDGMWFPTDKWNTRKPCDAGRERVARALFIARSWQTARIGDWDDADEDEREPFYKLADAAIASIHDQGVAE